MTARQSSKYDSVNWVVIRYSFLRYACITSIAEKGITVKGERYNDEEAVVGKRRKVSDKNLQINLTMPFQTKCWYL